MKFPLSQENKFLLSVCTETLTVDNSTGCKIFPHVRSRKLEITNQELSDSDTEELVTAMRDRVETVEMRDSVTLDIDSMTRHLTLIERGSKCRALFVPEKYNHQVPVWREIVRNNNHITIMFMTQHQAKMKSEKIREAGKWYPGYQPSASDIREAADLVQTGYLTTLKYLWLYNLDLSPSDEAAVKSLLSVCTHYVNIINVRGCDLIIKHVNSKELGIYSQTLSASETADLVTCMRDRVESVKLFSGVTLDVETVDTRIGELRQGTCREIDCWNNTGDKYREHLTKWANTLGWRTMETGDSFHIYR